MDDSDAMATSNPQSLIFASDSKAYIPRFQSTKMWVVNPATTDESGFKLGTVDLSAYVDDDGLPEMTQGVVVGDKLFLLVQRLDQDNDWLSIHGSEQPLSEEFWEEHSRFVRLLQR